MRRIWALAMLAAMMLLGAGCGPKESKEEVAATDAAIDQQQEEYRKNNPQADIPAKPAGPAATGATDASGSSGGPATN